MLKKTPIICALSITTVLILVLSISLFPVAASASDYMKLSTQDRIQSAKTRYSEYSANPNKEFEVMVSFDNASYTEISKLLSKESNIISAFHCFDGNGTIAYGGYTDCKAKSAEKVISEYYSSVYDLVLGQIESYEDYVNDLKKSFEVDENVTIVGNMIDSNDTYGKSIDDSPIVIEDSTKATDVTLEEELREAEESYKQFLLQKESMDRGEFCIYGIRLVMKGADIDSLLSSKSIKLVEILEFDNNNVITPISPLEKNR